MVSLYELNSITRMTLTMFLVLKQNLMSFEGFYCHSIFFEILLYFYSSRLSSQVTIYNNFQIRALHDLYNELTPWIQTITLSNS